MSTTFYNSGNSAATGVGTSNLTAAHTFNLTGSNPSRAVDIQVYNSQSPCSPQSLVLNTGANTINATVCPALATAGGVWIIPPASNSQTLSIKGISADTGLVLNPSVPTMLTFANPPPTSFVLTVAAGFTIEFIWF